MYSSSVETCWECKCRCKSYACSRRQTRDCSVLGCPNRPLWALHRSMAALENATFACAANERHLVALRMGDATSEVGLRSAAGQLPDSAPATLPCAAPMALDGEGDRGKHSVQSMSAPCAGCSPSEGRLAGMRNSQDGGSSQGPADRTEVTLFH